MAFSLRQFALVFPFLITAVFAQSSCSVALTASYPAPSVAAGFSARLIANKLKSPRGIIFDTQGHLLVVEEESGIVSLSLTDDGGDCVGVASSTTVVNDTSVCWR
jgi:glucose/arabinose dehydrogenase